MPVIKTKRKYTKRVKTVDPAIVAPKTTKRGSYKQVGNFPLSDFNLAIEDNCVIITQKRRSKK